MIGQTAPAMPNQVERPARQARADLLMGLALEAIRIAMPMYPATSDKAIMAAEMAAKLAKAFKRPPEDLGKEELKFLGSHLYGGGGSQGAMGSGPQIQQALQQKGVGSPMPAPGPAPIPTPEIPAAAAA